MNAPAATNYPSGQVYGDGFAAQTSQVCRLSRRPDHRPKGFDAHSVYLPLIPGNNQQNCTVSAELHQIFLQRYFQNIYFIKCPFERILLEHRKNKFIATFFTRNSLEHVLSVPGQFLTSQFFKVIFFQSQLQRFDTFGCINSSLFKILSLHETLFSRWLLLFEHGRSVLGLGAFDASVVWEPPEASAGTRHCRPLTLSVLSVRVVPEKNRNSKNRQKILTSTWF